MGVWPADALARAWARCASAEMHSGFAHLRQFCTMNCGLRVQLHRMETSLAVEIARVDELWNEGLSRFGGPFLAGSAFSAVDAFFAPVVLRVQTYGLSLSPNAAAYAAPLRALPSMREWYQDALGERQREAAHEAEARLYGQVQADYRVTE